MVIIVEFSSFIPSTPIKGKEEETIILYLSYQRVHIAGYLSCNAQVEIKT